MNTDPLTEEESDALKSLETNSGDSIKSLVNYSLDDIRVQNETTHTEPIREIQAAYQRTQIVKEEWWKEFIEWIKIGRAMSTMRMARLYTRHALRVLGFNTPISHGDAIRHMQAKLAAGKHVNDAINQQNLYMGMMFRYFIKMGYATFNPFEGMPKLPRIPRGRREIVEVEEYKAMREYFKNDVSMTWFLTCAWVTGLRISDIVGMNWDQVDLKKRIIYITPKKTKRHGIVLELPMPHELFKMVEHLALIRHSIAERGKGGPIGKRVCKDFGRWFHEGITPNHKLAEALAALGIKKKITAHCFRHSKATRLLNGDKSVNIWTAGKMLGIREERVLKSYTHITDEEKMRAMKI